MPTTVAHTIGSGGDYSTLQSWEDACPADLTSVDQIWQGECLNEEFVSGSTILTISGQTVDATRYVHLTAAAGASFVDNGSKLTNALRYNASNGAALRYTGGYSTGIVISTRYTRISRLQLQQTSSKGSVMSTGDDNVIDQCIIDGIGLGGSDAPLKVGSRPLITNSLIINNYASYAGYLFGIVGGGGGQTATLYNTTIIRPSDSGGGGIAMSNGYGYGLFKNCAIFGFTTFADFASISGSDYNASDLAIGTGSHNQASLTYADQFEDTTVASGDFRLKAGAALIDTGVDLSGSGVTTDIVGTARGATYDIGAWEYAASGVSVTLTGIGSTFSAGTLLPTRSLPLTGSAITGSAGAVTPASGLALSGSAATASAGTVAPEIAAAISGSAATAAAGTLGYSSALALTGSAVTGSAGALAIGLAVAIAGSAMTLSAGSLAYSAGFTLAGISTASASGTVGASGGDVETVKALTGLSIAVSPGNVRVTGGTPWVPQAARAIAIATAVGNTLPPPPRLTGDQRADIQAQGQWLSTLYDQLVKVNNVFGRINDHETRIASLEASNDNIH